MKLKKSSLNQAEAAGATAGAGGAVIANRFRLDVDPHAAKTPPPPGKAATIAAFCGALIVIVLLGTISTLMIVNWNTIADL